MTNTRIHWSEMDDKYWINDNDEVLWFDSSLDAKDALRAIEMRNAVEAEVKLIVDWFRTIGMKQCAAAIEDGDYKRG